MELVGVAAVGAIVLFLVILFLMYNSLVGKKNSADNAFASIDVQLKQRHDLIPNLVAAVKGAMEHERSTLEKLIELRTRAMTAGISQNESIQLENQISKGLSGIMVAVENYPNLKANENVIGLQKSLNEVESQIAAARRAFNGAITDYNNAIEMIPTNIVARFMGYTRRELFAAIETERQNPNVQQLFKT
jgi:LemA protein